MKPPGSAQRRASRVMTLACSYHARGRKAMRHRTAAALPLLALLTIPGMDRRELGTGEASGASGFSPSSRSPMTRRWSYGSSRFVARSPSRAGSKARTYRLNTETPTVIRRSLPTPPPSSLDSRSTSSLPSAHRPSALPTRRPARSRLSRKTTRPTPSRKAMSRATLGLVATSPGSFSTHPNSQASGSTY